MPIQLQVTLGDFRQRTADLPDETVLVIEFGDCDEFHEVHQSIKYFPASLDAPPALILDGGQEVTEDHYLIPRLDVWLEMGERI